jgi:hypothetical protein
LFTLRHGDDTQTPYELGVKIRFNTIPDFPIRGIIHNEMQLVLPVRGPKRTPSVSASVEEPVIRFDHFSCQSGAVIGHEYLFKFVMSEC